MLRILPRPRRGTLISVIFAAAGILLLFIAYQTGVWVPGQYITKMRVGLHEAPADPKEFTNEKNRTTTDTQTESLIRFEPFVQDPAVEDLTRDNAHQYPCSQPYGQAEGEIEDMMCLPRPSYLPEYKNPCFRSESGEFRCAPYFNLLGFDKCGTTDFHNRLVAHPAVLKCGGYLGKEVYFWGWRRLGVFMMDDVKPLSFDGYIDIFRKASIDIEASKNISNQLIVGDGGPIDAWDFRGWPREPQNKGLSEPKVLSPHVMRHLLKDPKFFVLVRDPVERMYSDYIFLGYGQTAEEFDRDVPIALEMMNSCLRVNTTRQCFYSNDMYHRLPMRLHISCYSVFLREWLSVFHRKHFFFLRTEDYHRDMHGSMQAAFAFLGVDTLPESARQEIVDLDMLHETKSKTKSGSMSNDTRKLLEDFYAPCNREMSRLLDDERFLWLDS